MNEMLRYTIIRVILFVMGGFLVLGCSDEDDVDNSGGTSKYGLIRMAEEDYDSSNTSYILQDEEPDEVLFDSSQRKFKVNEPLQVAVTEPSSEAAVTVTVTRGPCRSTLQAEMVRTVSPLAATELPAEQRPRKSCLPTNFAAALSMASAFSGALMRWW